MMFRRPGGDRRRNFSCRFFARGKSESKGGAFIATCASRGDCSLVRFHKRLADGQTKTESAKLCPATLFESIEDFRQRFRLDSQARIRDLDKQLSVGIVACGDENLALLLMKFHSTGVRGVRNSWLSIARNWSFARFDRAFSANSRLVFCSSS